MASFSLICSTQNATHRGLKEMLNSLAVQTNQDYEVVIVVGAGKAKTQAIVQSLLATYPKARMVLRPNQETLATSTNELLPTLTGDWLGFIGARDQLLPGTLAIASSTISGNPLTKVIFTDEECRDALNRITQRFDKLGINPIRLRHQEYLRDLVLFDKAWLAQLGGFNPVTSEWPSHDVFLRTLETLGPLAFTHIPQRLYQRFRIYRDRDMDLRRQAHLPGFDTQAIKLHLQRLRLEGKVYDNHRGTAEIEYSLSSNPYVHVFLICEGSVSESWARVRTAVAYSTSYGFTKTTVLYLNPDPGLAAELAYKCRAFGLTVQHVITNLPTHLNQEISRTDATYVALLRGEVLNDRWLKCLLASALLPKSGVIGGKCMTSSQLVWPGVLNHRYQNWDWNSRGKFNLLSVPHTVSVVSPSNMIFSIHSHLAADGFQEDLPDLFGADFCLRMGAFGLTNQCVPGATILGPDVRPSDAETALFQGRWSGWSDPYKLIIDPV